MNRIVILLALILIAGAILWFKPDLLEKAGLQFQSDLQKQAVDFQAQHSQDFIRYKHASEQNFSIAYPIGYMVVEDENENVTVSFIGLSPMGDSEVISIRATPGTVSESELQDAFDNVKKNGLGEVAQTSSIENGKTVFVISISLDDPTSKAKVFIRHATYPDCTDELGNPYYATITTSISESLQDDLPTVNYMIHSFNC